MNQTRAEGHIEAFIFDEHSATLPSANRIHSAEGGKEFGFSGALVGGITIYGWAVPTIIKALGEEWVDSGWAEFRFRKPTYQGDRLTFVVEPQSDGAHSLTALGPDGAARMVGRVGLGEAPWYGDLAHPERLVAEPPVEDGRQQLTMDNAPVGQDFRPMTVDGSEETAREMSGKRLGATEPLFVGERPRIHPSTYTNLTGLAKHTYDFAPSIHTATLVQHRRPAYAGQSLTLAGKCVEVFHRGTDDYVVVDGVVLDENKEVLKHIRHTVIFSVAKRV